MNTTNLIPHITQVSSDSVTDGIYDFDVGNLHEPLSFFLDGFHFVDGEGGLATPTGGAVGVEVSSDRFLWRQVHNGSFAANTPPAELTPPSGLAPVVSVRVVLTGVMGASGFRANFVKGG